MRTSIAYAPTLLNKIAQVTDDPEEQAVLAGDCAYRFLVEHPSDTAILNAGVTYEPEVNSDINCLGGSDHPVEWSVFAPSGGLGGWEKTWSPADAGLHGWLARECQILIEQEVAGRDGAEAFDRETAARLLRKYKSLEAMVDNLDQIKPKKLRPAIVEAWDRGVPTKRSLIATETAMTVAFDTFPFLKVYENEIRIRGQDVSTENYVGVQTEDALVAMATELEKAPWLAVDTETTGLDLFWLDVCGVSLSAKSGRAFYIPTGHETDEPQLNERRVAEVLRALFLNKPLVFHNASFDLRTLAKILGISWKQLLVMSDTQLKAFVCGFGTGDERGTLKLDNLVRRFLRIVMQPIEELIGKRKQDQIPFSRVPIWKAIPYAAEDADMTGRLERFIDPMVDKLGVRSVMDMELAYLPIIVKMEEAGVAVNLDVIGDIDDTIAVVVAEAEETIFTQAGHQFNLAAPADVAAVLYDELQLPPGKKNKTGFSTEALHLKTLVNQHPIIQPLLDHREMTKLKSTYVDNLQKYIHPMTGRLHVSWNQCGAASGRLSSSGGQTSKINLQNQPVRTEVGAAIRRAFVPEPPNLYVGGDYSQIELRITAHVSEDVNMIADFESGEDFHRRTAARMNNISAANVTDAQRGLAKNFNFGVNYRITPSGAAIRFGVTKERATELIKLYYQTYPRVKEWQDAMISFARRLGYTETMFGRKRWFPDINDESSKVRADAERAAINLPIQGTAADIIKMAMSALDLIIVDKNWDDLVQPLMQVHDEVIYEAHPAVAEELAFQMEPTFSNIVKLKVPVIFEVIIGTSWKDLK